MKKNGIVLITIVIVVTVGVLAWWLFSRRANTASEALLPRDGQAEQQIPENAQEAAPEPDAVITFTPEGYEPNEVAIQKGDTVQFRSTRDGFYWPASDVHPTHEEYSAFDPQRPLASDETWSFTFDQVGSWDFHDHLYSRYTGVITVSE